MRQGGWRIIDNSEELENVTNKEDLMGCVGLDGPGSIPRALADSLKCGGSPPASHTAILCSKEFSCLMVSYFPFNPRFSYYSQIDVSLELDPQLILLL